MILFDPRFTKLVEITKGLTTILCTSVIHFIDFSCPRCFFSLQQQNIISKSAGIRLHFAYDELMLKYSEWDTKLFQKP